MSSFTVVPPNAPVIKLALVGIGEPLLRMEKRLTCAASGLNIRLEITIHKDATGMGIEFAQTPVVMQGDKLIFSGLPRTEEIEAWLKNLI